MLVPILSTSIGRVHAFWLYVFRRMTLGRDRQPLLKWCWRMSITPKHLKLYEQAFTHTSVLGEQMHQRAAVERLEYLGDAVLDLIIAETLYGLYPQADEGLLTSMRSKIVNNNHLGKLSEQLGIAKILIYKGRLTPKMLSNVLEALLGALYLDKGVGSCTNFVKKQLLARISMETLRRRPLDYKGVLIQWAQQRNLVPHFENAPILNRGNLSFQSTLYLDRELIFVGDGQSKKQAEQQASKKAYLALSD